MQIPFSLVAILMIAPLSVSAAVTLTSILSSFTASLSNVVGLLVAVALVVFLWGVIGFMFNAGDEKARSSGRLKIQWGLLGLTVIICVWGIVNIIRVMVGTNNVTVCPSPTIEIGGGTVTTTECM